MKTRIAVLADYASISIDHKLNVLGIFSSINASETPTPPTPMKLVTQFEFDSSEVGQKQIKIALVNADGQELFAINGAAEIRPTPDGRPALLNQILDLSTVALPAFGEYEFRVLLDGRTEAEIPLTVLKLTAPPVA